MVICIWVALAHVSQCFSNEYYFQKSKYLKSLCFSHVVANRFLVCLLLSTVVLKQHCHILSSPWVGRMSRKKCWRSVCLCLQWCPPCCTHHQCNSTGRLPHPPKSTNYSITYYLIQMTLGFPGVNLTRWSSRLHFVPCSYFAPAQPLNIGFWSSQLPKMNWINLKLR